MTKKVKQIKDKSGDMLQRVEREREGLGQAIRQFAVDIGICRPDAAPTGPELLMLLCDAKREIERLRSR